MTLLVDPAPMAFAASHVEVDVAGSVKTLTASAAKSEEQHGDGSDTAPHAEASCCEKENLSSVEASNQEQAQSESPATQDTKKSKKHVRFEDAEVLEFEPSAWTATVSSDGVPIGMSGTLRRRTRRRLDSYENERCLCRVSREEYMEHGYLEPDERLDILENAGHSASIISHVEKETIRINRERWESNEYDMLYQYGLGEVAMLDMDEEDEAMFLGQQRRDNNDLADDDVMMQSDDMMDDESYYYTPRNVLVDAEVRFAMEEMDAYDTRQYEELNVDYAVDCILGDDDDDSDENNELPYAKDSFVSPCSFALSDMMSSSPTDVSSATECMIVSCSSRGKASSPTPSASY
uniref:Uncharacterized protein n=1 Tax=Globisporangium ultimum (strain ATCC 200006 / CBS 805.95 / DAOM BR144) TaxID=431595 RepID=K3WSG8_GLOUD